MRSLDVLDTAPDERFDRLTRLARHMFGVPIALISLVDAQRLWFKSSPGLRVGAMPRDGSFSGRAILDDAVLVVPEATLDKRFCDHPLVVGEPKVRFYAGCPLTAPSGSRIGTLCLLDTEPRTLDPTECGLLQDLARLAEQELAAAQLATIDDLTHIANRRGFLTQGQHALSLCARMERPASLHFFDLDGFKQINDAFGHAEGDRALVAFAALLTKTFRDSDIVGRLGGDEFAVLITDGSERARLASIERLGRAVRSHNRNSKCGYEIQFSVGEVNYEPLRHGSITSMLADADALMYQRKRQKQAA